MQKALGTLTRKNTEKATVRHHIPKGRTIKFLHRNTGYYFHDFGVATFLRTK